MLLVICGLLLPSQLLLAADLKQQTSDNEKKKIAVLTIINLLLLSAEQIPNTNNVRLKWDASANATGYKLYMSTNKSGSWNTGKDVGNVTSFVYPDVPNAGLVLFRASAYNNHGEAISFTAGTWYCGDCTK